MAQQKVEEVSMKWGDRPRVTEMEKGGVYEISTAHCLPEECGALMCSTVKQNVAK